MPRIGIGLMVLGVIGTTALIGLSLEASANATVISIAASVGTMALLLAGYHLFSRHRHEGGRLDDFASDTEQHARINLLKNREAELRRQIETLEHRRDETLTEMGEMYETVRRHPSLPKLIVVPNAE